MILDLGIFLEYYLDDGYAAECENIIDDLDAGTLEGQLTDFHLHGTCAVFNTYVQANAPDEIQDFVYGVGASDGIELYRLSLGDTLEICDIQRNSRLDFDDAALVRAADVLDENVILSLDAHLNEYDGDVSFDSLHPANY